MNRNIRPLKLLLILILASISIDTLAHLVAQSGTVLVEPLMVERLVAESFVGELTMVL